MNSFIHDFGILFLIIVFFSFIIKLAKQPIIIGYVLAGLFFSFYLSSGNTEEIIVIAELGITFLLFLMGLEFDLKSLKYLGKDIIIATVMQSLIFFCIGFLVSLAFKFSTITSAYIGVLFMFSSTLLLAKWIHDKKETDMLYAKIAMGMTIIEDIIAIIVLTFLSVIKEKSIVTLLFAPLKGILLLILVIVFMRYVLGKLFRFTLRYPELLFVFSLGVCFLFVEIALKLKYSETIGAFLAGVVIASTSYKNDVQLKLNPLIVFFNMLFFVGLGFQLNTELNYSMLGVIIVLSIFSLTLKPLISYTMLKFRGFDTKTAFIVGINLCSLSEFGMIVIAGGVAAGLISNEISAIAVICVIGVMILASYIIKNDKKIYKYFEPHLKKMESKFKDNRYEGHAHDFSNYEIVFFGYQPIEKKVFEKLKGEKKIFVIEDNPLNIEILKKLEIDYIYNSVNNPDFFEHANFSKVELAVSNIKDVEDNKMIIKQLKDHNPKCAVIVAAKNLKDSLELYSCNADYVLCPYYLNEQQIIVLLEDYTNDINRLISRKINDLTKLKEIGEHRKGNGLKSAFLDIGSFLNNLSKKNKNRNNLEAQSILDGMFKEKK